MLNTGYQRIVTGKKNVEINEEFIVESLRLYILKYHKKPTHIFVNIDLTIVWQTIDNSEELIIKTNQYAKSMLYLSHINDIESITKGEFYDEKYFKIKKGA